MQPARRTARIFGVLFLATFVFSIAAVLLYNPVLHPATFMAGTGSATRVRLGLMCEVLLIIANVGTAVVIFPILRRQNETLALGYIAVRLIEATFIVIGTIALIAVVTLRHDGGASLLADAKSLVAVRNWTFVIGPGFWAGVGNGLILGYLMYRSGLMPQGLAILGLVGGSLICISGIGVVLDVIPKGGTAQTVATIPDFVWELSLGIYPIFKGFKGSLTAPETGPPLEAVAFASSHA